MPHHHGQQQSKKQQPHYADKRHSLPAQQTLSNMDAGMSSSSVSSGSQPQAPRKKSIFDVDVDNTFSPLNTDLGSSLGNLLDPLTSPPMDLESIDASAAADLANLEDGEIVDAKSDVSVMLGLTAASFSTAIPGHESAVPRELKAMSGSKKDNNASQHHRRQSPAIPTSKVNSLFEDEDEDDKTSSKIFGLPTIKPQPLPSKNSALSPRKKQQHHDQQLLQQPRRTASIFSPDGASAGSSSLAANKATPKIEQTMASRPAGMPVSIPMDESALAAAKEQEEKHKEKKKKKKEKKEKKERRDKEKKKEEKGGSGSERKNKKSKDRERPEKSVSQHGSPMSAAAVTNNGPSTSAGSGLKLKIKMGGPSAASATASSSQSALPTLKVPTDQHSVRKRSREPSESSANSSPAAKMSRVMGNRVEAESLYLNHAVNSRGNGNNDYR